MLAKIGYSFAVAELGVNGFDSLILPLIRGKDRANTHNFVGSVRADGKGTQEHEVHFVDLHPDFVTVSIRLFGTLGLGTHYVVVGRKLRGSADSTSPLHNIALTHFT